MSAAVIGRQLRQQATTGRTSGPLVPPQVPGKGRPRTPSHAPTSSGRPYSPALGTMTGGTSSERYNVIPGAGGGGEGRSGGSGAHSGYPSSHPHGLHGEKDRNKGEEPKLRCTWHCFCVALKALSGGLVLFVAGTIMSVVGFVADANHNSTQVLSNDTVIETPLPSVFRNLTFAGPVIMGLGGIVIVAALVLTFEVRDTLGVKVVPSKPNTTSNNTNNPAPSLTLNNNVHPASRDTTGKGVGEGGKNGSKSFDRSEPIPSIASTLSPENRIAGQSINGQSLLKKANLELGLTSTAAKTTGTTLSAGATRSSNNNQGLTGNQISSSKLTNVNEIIQQQQQLLRNGSAGITGSRGGKLKLDPSSLTIPFDVLSDLGPGAGSLRRPRPNEVHSSETAFNGLLTLDESLILDSGRTNVPTNYQPESRTDNSKVSRKGNVPYHGYPVPSDTRNRHEAKLQSTSSTASLSNVISPNLESYYFALPSPQETELSDPEGCSLKVPARWRSSRCSCSASPTHSMSMELYSDRKEPPINIKIIEQQRIQEQLIIQQQILLKQQQDQLQRLIEQTNLGRTIPFHRPKVLASIESDGLSSTSSSSDDLFVPLRRSRPPSSASPYTHQHHISAPQHHQHLKLSHPRPASYQQKLSSTGLYSHHHHHHDQGPTTTLIDEPYGPSSSSFGFRSEISSEFSSNASEYEAPLHIDLDEDLSKALGKLKSPVKSCRSNKLKDKLPSIKKPTLSTEEDESNRDDVRDTSESTRLLSTTSKISASSPNKKSDSGSTSNNNKPSAGANTSGPSSESTSTDKRLLRDGALTNGSVPNRKR